MVLEDLVLNRNLKMNRVTQTIALPANTFGPVNLEADYLRTYDLFYPMPTNAPLPGQDGITMFLNPSTTKQYDAEFKDSSTANYPYEFSTDLSPQATGGLGLLYVYPQSSGALSLTHRYMIKRADIATPESSSSNPWFQNTDYLVKATSAKLMMVTGDDRHDSFVAQCEAMLRPYLIMEGDEQETVHNIALDPRHFRSNRALKLTKSQPM
jgi:hypothetical protein